MVASSIAVFSTGCANKQALLGDAFATEERANIAEEAIAEGKKLPDQPPDCRRKEKSGIVLGDRLDAATIKAERALRRANARSGRCSAWYDDLQRGSAK